VLARKYRPQTFAELIGQEAMVRTLGNAIKRDRIAHAFPDDRRARRRKDLHRPPDRQGAELHRARTGRAVPPSIRATSASRAAPLPKGATST
jgi:hypothetical protein